MLINVLTELRQPMGTVTTVDIDEEDPTFEGLQLHALRGTVRLIRINRGLLVEVNATGAAGEACSRCLKDLALDVEVEFQEEYVPVIDANNGARVRSEAPPDLFRIREDFVLDLREGIRQYLLMSEPAKPLCRPNCAGLCPRCGADLNIGQCSCTDSSDERWHALAGLTFEQPGGK
jgi:DUF177 domain-containing protein